MKRLLLFGVLAVIFVSALAACGESEAPATQIIEVPKEIVVEKEVIKEVPVIQVVEKEVVKIVEVPGETVVVEKEVEVIKTVVEEVEKIREVVKIVEVIKEVEVAAKMSYSEAPLLAQFVQIGQLPPVEERLPENPLVIPALEVGRYGGTIRRVYFGRADFWNYGRISRQGLVRWSTDGSVNVPAIASEWSSTADGKEWTFKLRKGTRWSDGAPFTADDFAYHYQDVMMNEELAPNKPSRMKIKGEMGSIEKVDDYTVKFVFPHSNFVFPAVVSQMDSPGGTNQPYAPAHYMKQFHTKHNPNAEQAAQDAGFEGGWTFYYANRFELRDNPDRPTMRPWVPAKGMLYGSALLFTAERNPYFYGVDQVGNQLPYIDRLQYTQVQDNQILQLKAIAGEIDFQARHVNLSMYPLLKENEDKGGYHMTMWPALTGAEIALSFNQQWDGPESVYFQNLDFRIALSHAIDRNEINEISYLGQGVPRQPAPAPSMAHYPGADYEFRWTEYDPDLSNEMLDKIMPNKDSEGFRLMENGKRLHIIMDTTPGEGRDTDTIVMIKEFWGAVGVSAKVNEITRTLLQDRFKAGQDMLTIWGHGIGDPSLEPASAWMDRSHPQTGIWYLSDGENGVEPDPIVKQITDMRADTATLPRAERVALSIKLAKLQLDQLYQIGVTGLSPSNQGVVITSNRLANVPDVAGNAWMMRTPSTAFPEQFFFKQ